MSIEVMKQALEAIELSHPRFGVATEIYMNAIVNLRAAIEHAERPQTHSEECWRWHHQCAVARIERMQAQKPVAWMYVNEEGECDQIDHIEKEPMPDDPSITPLYTAPRQWQGLTDEEIAVIMVRELGVDEDIDAMSCFARSIEAKLREKHT